LVGPPPHRAELWRSDDPTLHRRILESVPLYDPDQEMTLVNHRASGQAMLFNLTFAAAALDLTAIIFLLPKKVGHLPSAYAKLLLAVVLIGMFFCASGMSVAL
jgi:hypothetical protein